MAELFLFEFFDLPSRKLLKRVKVSHETNVFFFSLIIEAKEEDEAEVV